MFKIVELFSGIGSQAKAMRGLDIDYQIIATAEWDIHAIIAYDLIHNGSQNINEIKEDHHDVINFLSKFNFSLNGKRVLEKSKLKKLKIELLYRLFIAVKRTRNLVNINDIKFSDFKEDIDLLTYSFPCQDLSISANWHGNTSGIDRNANNRSSMLWEVERLLFEFKENNISLPKYLLMENVTNILSKSHAENFNEWKDVLSNLGYINQVYTLNSNDFAIPQKRKRTFMLSIHEINPNRITAINQYLDRNNLEFNKLNRKLKDRNILEFLRLDYNKKIYRDEANDSQPNNTPSRRKIYKENLLIHNGQDANSNYVNTITTKQDRNPNSGVIDYFTSEKKAQYRNLTPRECFLFMGFEESDYNSIVENNFKINKSRYFFTKEKLVKLAGNSIVVNVLEAIFQQILEIEEI